MRFTWHRTRAVFDRYNVVEDADVRAAVRRLEHDGKDQEEVAGGATGTTKALPAKD